MGGALDALLEQQAEQRGCVLDQPAVVGEFLKQVPAFRAVRPHGALVVGKDHIPLLIQGVVVLSRRIKNDEHVVFALVGTQASGQMQQHIGLAGRGAAQNQHVPVNQAGAYGQIDAFAHAVCAAQRKE